MSSVNLLPLTSEYLDLILEWRNMPEVRRNMYTNHVISKEEHYTWFCKVENDSTKAYFVFELNGKPAGLISFVDINEKSKSATWAFYSGNTSTRGIGSSMEVLALNYAFDTLGLHKLSCEVLEFNNVVVNFHKKYGFHVEGFFREHHYSDETYCGVYRLAIFSDEWEKCKLELNIKKNSLSPGSVYREAVSFTNKQVVKFSELSGDCNKINISNDFAIENGFDNNIIHGFLVGSVFSKVFGTTFPGNGCVYISQSMKFLNPVYPDDLLEAFFVVSSKIGRKLIVETSVINVKTNKMVIDGVAELLISKRAQREYLNNYM
jgi:UDP-4-amino-4,6-dideoxy-N-acetyl-beta-L-altrosamine N-acetyltransferase